MAYNGFYVTVIILNNLRSTSKSSKNAWVMVLMMLMGIVAGGFLGQLLTSLANSVSFFSFLNIFNYSHNFGMSSPLSIDLGVISFTIGLMINFNIWGIIGIIIAIIIYRKM